MMKYGNKSRYAVLMVSGLSVLGTNVALADTDAEVLERIRPIGKIKVMADRDVGTPHTPIPVITAVTPKALPVETEDGGVGTSGSAAPAVTAGVTEPTAPMKETVAAEPIGDVEVSPTSEVVTPDPTTSAAVVETIVSHNIAEQTSTQTVVVATTVNQNTDVAATDSSTTAVAIDGKKIYAIGCAACHDAGLVGAPRFGDKVAWAPRIAKGEAALLHSAINGLITANGAMPARGSCINCSDEDIKAAVQYVISQSK